MSRGKPPEPGALPLIFTHDWPGSVTEFLPLSGALSERQAHGEKVGVLDPDLILTNRFREPTGVNRDQPEIGQRKP